MEVPETVSKPREVLPPQPSAKLHVSVSRIAAFVGMFTGVDVLYQYAARGTASAISVASSIVAGLLLGLLLSFVASRLPLRLRARVGLVWLGLFIIQMFSNLLEGAFFSTTVGVPEVFFGGILVGALVTLAEAAFAGILFVPARGIVAVRTALHEYFGARPVSAWLWRGALGSVVYFPVYFAFGVLAGPVVLPYYTDPSFGLNLRIPGFEVIIPLEFLRGLLYVVALLPLLAVLKVPRRTLWPMLAAMLFVPGAVLPFLTNDSWPVFLRTVHGAEILGDSVVYGGILASVFRRP